MPPDAPKTRLDDLAIDEVSGVDKPAHMEDGWMVLKSQAATMGLTPEAMAEILAGALEIAAEEGYTFSDEEEDEAKDEAKTDKDESPADVADATPPTTATIPAPSAPADTSTEPSEVLKALPDELRTIVLKAQADAAEATSRAEEATSALQKARDSHADADAVRKAREDWAYIPGLDPTTFGPLLRKSRDDNPAFADVVSGLLTAANAALAESSLFTAAGSPTASSGISELDQAVVKARGEHPDWTKAQLIAEAVRVNPDLYDHYRLAQREG
jgi:hypothetical protein